MQAIRRHDYAARIEILPLIDVVFLLLTFFIYSMFVMVRLDMLSVELAPLGTGQRVEPSQVETLTVTIDRKGGLSLGQDPLTADELIQRLRPADAGSEPPMVFITMSKESDVDRAPIVLDIIRRFVEAGFRKYTFVGPPAQLTGSPQAR